MGKCGAETKAICSGLSSDRGSWEGKGEWNAHGTEVDRQHEEKGPRSVMAQCHSTLNSKQSVVLVLVNSVSFVVRPRYRAVEFPSCQAFQALNGKSCTSELPNRIRHPSNAYSVEIGARECWQLRLNIFAECVGSLSISFFGNACLEKHSSVNSMQMFLSLLVWV